MIAGHFAPTAALWRRDLMRTLRKRRTAVFLTAYVGLLAMMILSNWPSRDMTPYMVQSYAETSLVMFVMLSYVWVGMIMPPYGAAALTQEHERETMEMLTLTLVPPWGVVLGKWGAHTGLFLFVLLAAMPVMAAATFFTVGIEVVTFVALVGLVASTSITCVAIGVAFSSITKSSKAAVIFSYIGVAMMMGLHLMIFAAMIQLFFGLDSDWTADPQKTFEFLTRYFTPIGATFYLLNGGASWPEYAGAQLYLWTISLASFAFACWRFARLNKKTPRLRRATTIESNQTKKRKRKPKRMRPMGDRQNAWYAREARFGTLTGRRVRWGMFFGGSLVFGLIASGFLVSFYRDQAYDGQGNEYVEAWCGVLLVAMSVVVPGIAANTFTREFDGSRMDLLRGTLLRPRDYVFGSIRSTVRSITPLFFAVILTTFILSPAFAGDGQTFRTLLTGAGSVAATIGMATTIGIAAGTITRRTASALMLAYASVFGAFIGVWLAIFYTGEVVAWMSVRSGGYQYQNAPKLEPLRDLFLISSPVLAYFDNLSTARQTGLVTESWMTSVALSGTYSIVFTLAAILGFRYRMARDA